MSISSGIPTQAESRPEWGRNHSIRITLDNTAIGPIEMSSPPPPDRIAGVLASATMANGARGGSSAGPLPGLPKLGSAMTLAISRPSASAAANSQGRRRSCSAKERSHDRMARELRTRQLLADPAVAEDEDAVHQLHVLVDLGREHHDRHALSGQVEQQLIKVALGADVDGARRVVEQQHLRPGGQPACHDALLLVAARQRRDPVVGIAELDLQAVDVLGEPLLGALG